MFACSGPGAGAAIARSIEIGYTHAGVLAGLLMVSVAVFARGPRRWDVPVVLLVLLLLHPAWTISAISGDCGFFKRDASRVVTGLGCAALCWQVARAVRWVRGETARKNGPAEHAGTGG